MNNQQNDITLESIAQQKAALRKRIGSQKQKVSTLTQGFMAPLKPSAKKATPVMGLLNTGMVVFDGLLIGYKMLRKFNKLLRH